MSDTGDARQAVTRRREPPRFRNVAVARTERLSGRMIRVTIGGPDLTGFAIGGPAASVRLLLPSPGSAEVEIPMWNGNEFLRADGRRPIIRTFTPRRFDPDALELDIDMVIHSGGAASQWAVKAIGGAPVAVSGPDRSYAIDLEATRFLLAGDESAIPAMAQLLEHISTDVCVQVDIEITDVDAKLELPTHPRATVERHTCLPGARPGDAVVMAIRDANPDSDCKIWCAGEAAAMHRVRSYLFEERGLPRTQATVRGYWKLG